MKVADKSYYTNADKSKLAKEGSSDAAYLVVGEGGEVTAEMTEQYGIKGVEQKVAEPVAGVVTSATGDDNVQGFVPAAELQETGTVVSGVPPAPTKTTKKAATKTTTKSAKK